VCAGGPPVTASWEARSGWYAPVRAEPSQARRLWLPFASTPPPKACAVKAETRAMATAWKPLLPQRVCDTPLPASLQASWLLPGQFRCPHPPFLAASGELAWPTLAPTLQQVAERSTHNIGNGCNIPPQITVLVE